MDVTTLSVLAKYLDQHTFDATDSNAKDVVDMVFFKVGFQGDTNAEEFLRMLTPTLAHGELQWPWPAGKEVSYLELGACLDSQGTALVTMALGARLGVWKLLSPYTVLGGHVTEEVAKQMAGLGLVTVVANRSSDT